MFLTCVLHRACKHVLLHACKLTGGRVSYVDLGVPHSCNSDRRPILSSCYSTARSFVKEASAAVTIGVVNYSRNKSTAFTLKKKGQTLSQ